MPPIRYTITSSTTVDIDPIYILAFIDTNTFCLYAVSSGLNYGPDTTTFFVTYDAQTKKITAERFLSPNPEETIYILPITSPL